MKALEFARRRPSLTICLALGLLTFLLYLPVIRNGFVDYDDQGYITDNIHVTAGLSWPGIVWAFKSNEQANWHPLTWISHMADCQMFGTNPAGHHFTNILFHTANTLLVFFLLKQMTRELWASTLVAAFFGWHPLHVESVAWASERKDVLSAFFWLLTMMVYVKYVKKPGAFTYLAALVLFACALLSKPMAVTLPFALLLVDFWPLNRFESAGQTATPNPPGQKTAVPWQTGIFLILEKLPFFALSFADCYVTYLLDNPGGAVMSASTLPFSYRFANALWSYLRYVSSTLCPTGLCIIYPYKAYLPVGLVTVSILLLVIWSGLFLFWRKKFPYLLVGWFWFLGTLVPVIGLIQVGAQAMADRYMYIPSIGLFIIIVWGVKDLIRFHPATRNYCFATGAAALTMCLVTTSWQIKYWHDTASLFVHAIRVTGDNTVAYFTLGATYEQAGDTTDALALYKKSAEMDPNYLPTQFGLARILLENGDYPGAKPHLDYAESMNTQNPELEISMGFILQKIGRNAEGVKDVRRAVQMKPDSPAYHNYLAYALQKMTNTDEAIREFSTALQLEPDYPNARYGLASALIAAGRTNEAIAQYQIEIQQHPNNPEAHYNLGLAFLDNRQFADAEKEFSIELKLSPGELKAHYRLAEALTDENKFADAVAEYRKALQILPNFPDAKKELASLLAAHPEMK